MTKNADQTQNDAPQKPETYSKEDNKERFHLRSNPSPNGEILGKFATREEADRAHKSKLDEIAEARAKAVSPGDLPIVVDMGVRSPSADAANEAREVAKSAEQKDLEEAREVEKKNAQEQSESHVLTGKNNSEKPARHAHR